MAASACRSARLAGCGRGHRPAKAEGALVSSVEADGPADKAGVQPGDVILKFNGETIKRWSDLPRIVGETKPGTSADLEVWRKGKTITLPVKVGEIPAEKGGGAKKGAAPPRM